MTSEEARELFSAAVESELDEATRSEFEAALRRDAQLADDYASFAALLARTRPAADDTPPPPDLLPGVQRKLRERSRGRFYGDRFAERVGAGMLQPWTLALILLALVFALWFGLSMFEGVTLTPPARP